MVPLREPLIASFAPARGAARDVVRRGFRVRVMAAVVACFLVVSLRADDLAATAEYEAKADRLLTLAHFVEWPMGTLVGNEPLVIGVLGREDAAGIIARHLSGRTMGTRPVEVRRTSLADLAKETHILLVTQDAGATPAELRAALDNAPTLLVGETEAFAERGGAMALVSDGNKLRIALCPEHARQLGLKLSSRLFQVGRAVRPAPKA